MKKDISSIVNLISLGNYVKALEEAFVIKSKEPLNLDIRKLIVQVRGLTEHFEDGEKEIREVFEINPNIQDYDIYNNMGYFLMKNEDFEEALTYLEKSIVINPGRPEAYSNIAEIHIVTRQFHLAEEFIDLAIEKHIEQDSSLSALYHTLSLKADINTALKKNNESIKMCIDYLNISFVPNIFWLQTTIDPSSVDDKTIDSSKKVLEQKNNFRSKIEKFEYTIPILFGLANYYQKIDKIKSEDYFHQANDEIFNILRFNLYTYQKRLIEIMDFYSEKIKNHNMSNSDSGESNIFVIGTPRSGTTLTESIIASNKDVFAGGELLSFQNLCEPFFKEGAEIDIIIDQLQKKYAKRTAYLKGNHKFIVDKLPGNHQLLGLIFKFLPKSKVVRIYRDPWDTAISLYKQRFVKNQPYSASFFTLGVFMANFEAINLFWDTQISDKSRLMTIYYEELVKNKEYYQKKIYDFLDIASAYDEQERANFFAKTASIQQVQADIHAKSVKKSDFEGKKTEFFDAFFQQRQYWIKKGLVERGKDDILGYSIKNT